MKYQQQKKRRTATTCALAGGIGVYVHLLLNLSRPLFLKQQTTPYFLFLLVVISLAAVLLAADKQKRANTQLASYLASLASQLAVAS